MIFTRFLSLAVLSFTFLSASALPTPTTGDDALAKRWHEDHKRHHPATGENARPSPSASGTKKKEKAAAAANVALFVNLPLGAPEDLARCPATQMACPITPLKDIELLSATSETPFECISPQEDLYSCGGCATLGTGLDCTAIPGVLSVSCAVGTCNVHTCEEGYTISAVGHSCEPTA
ncbi:hypothetical protein IAU59_004696 [Kwoniella sp. CBS 9459]